MHREPTGKPTPATPHREARDAGDIDTRPDAPFSGLSQARHCATPVTDRRRDAHEPRHYRIAVGTVIAATVPAIFAAAVALDPARPMLTYYDDGAGERTELSGATLANWAAKTANQLVDGHGLGPGDTAALRLPPHWQTAGVLLGCWAAGLSVDTGLAGERLRGGGPGPVGAAYVAADRLPSAPPADATFALGLHPLGAPMSPPPPPGVLDYAVDVRQYGDHFAPAAPVAAEDLAEDGLSHEDLLARARDWATDRGLDPNERILFDADSFPDPLVWLVAPLVVGATIVLCRRLDRARLDARVSAERVTHAVLS